MSYLSSVSRFSMYSLAMNRNRFMISGQGQQVNLGQQMLGKQVGVQGQEALLGQHANPSTEGVFAGNRKVSEKGDFDTYECQTCKNRKYQDGSNDPGVSFKTPTTISPERAAFAIRSHEAEHVAHARLKALEEDKEIVSQSVSYRTSICPECGRTFMAGGNTRTVFRSAPETYSQEPVKKGVYLDRTA